MSGSLEVLRFTCNGQQELKHRFAVPSVTPLREGNVQCSISLKHSESNGESGRGRWEAEGGRDKERERERERERESFNLLKKQTGRFYCRVKGCERGRGREWAGAWEGERERGRERERWEEEMMEDKGRYGETEGTWQEWNEGPEWGHSRDGGLRKQDGGSLFCRDRCTYNHENVNVCSPGP